MIFQASFKILATMFILYPFYNLNNKLIIHRYIYLLIFAIFNVLTGQAGLVEDNFN